MAAGTRLTIREEAITMEKRLHRARNDRKLAGVCGGVAEYFGWDPTLVRVGWIVLTLMGGSGILLYLIMWLVMPEAS
jgi:phage shock protein C